MDDRGDPRWTLTRSDIARLPLRPNENHIRARFAEGHNKTYGIVHPQSSGNPSNLPLAPYHASTGELGAVFFQAGGWERPHWYDVERQLVEE